MFIVELSILSFVAKVLVVSHCDVVVGYCGARSYCDLVQRVESGRTTWDDNKGSRGRLDGFDGGGLSFSVLVVVESKGTIAMFSGGGRLDSGD